MTVQRRYTSAAGQNMKALLSQLGLNYYADPNAKRTPEMRRENFWVKNEASLHFILHDAGRRYRELIVRHHPDHGGTTGRAIELNVAWRQIRRVFKLHGIT